MQSKEKLKEIEVKTMMLHDKVRVMGEKNANEDEPKFKSEVHMAYVRLQDDDQKWSNEKIISMKVKDSMGVTDNTVSNVQKETSIPTWDKKMQYFHKW